MLVRRYQEDAFKAGDALDPTGEHLRPFAIQVWDNGGHAYMMADYGFFWFQYNGLPPAERHHYEIIRDGQPCHLYCDLEYIPAFNPGKDGQAAVDAVLSLLRETLAEQLDVEMEDGGVIELDSSTDAKFSRHLTVRLPNKAFLDNMHAGDIVKGMVETAKEMRGQDPRADAIFVLKEDGKVASFVDTAVYTKNRAFRLHLSSKLGKTATLQPTGRFGTAGLTPKQVFMASLVCNVQSGVELLRYFDETVGPRTHPRLGGPRAPGSSSSRSNSRFIHGPSPYPALDNHITNVAAHGLPTAITGWMPCYGGKELLLGLRTYARPPAPRGGWCWNVGRHHKGNGVYYIVNLEHGWYFQRCHDPDCRRTGYYSAPAKLPRDLAMQVWRAWILNGGDGGDVPPPEDEEDQDDEEGWAALRELEAERGFYLF